MLGLVALFFNVFIRQMVIIDRLRALKKNLRKAFEIRFLWDWNLMRPPQAR
jgi:hypothetical protein